MLVISMYQLSVECLKIIPTKKNVSLFWRIRKSGESRISSPWRYHLTCRGGPPRTLHSRTTTWPSDAWASCSSCTEEKTLKQADESHKRHGKRSRQEAAEDESLSSEEPRGPLDISNCLRPRRTPLLLPAVKLGRARLEQSERCDP